MTKNDKKLQLLRKLINNKLTPKNHLRMLYNDGDEIKDIIIEKETIRDDFYSILWDDYNSFMTTNSPFEEVLVMIKANNWKVEDFYICEGRLIHNLYFGSK